MGRPDLVIDTTPRTISPRVRSFCASVAAGSPAFVRCRPDSDAQPGSCFDNVVRKVGRAGGTTVAGWAIWTIPGLYIEAEHHGVWSNRDGQLVDVTPQPNRPKRIVFLRDDGAVYEPTSFRSNIMRPASEHPLAIEFVELGNRSRQIEDAYRAGGNRLALFTLSDQRELGILKQRMAAIWRQVVG